jgi:uncharacterized membrane protein YedE/YeeE
MARGLAAGLIGVVFGLTLSWSGLSSPEVIRQGLLFEQAYLFLFFASALAVAFVGLRLVRATRPHALLTGTETSWRPAAPRRHHVVGSVIFGAGWAMADACPGPIATQVGQGVPWALCTAVGVLLGVALYLRRQPRAA